MLPKPPTITLSPLDRTDGSASYSNNGYTILAGVNGPVEVQRRDELPEEATIDVNIRPAAGVGGVYPSRPYNEFCESSKLKKYI